MNGVPLHPAVVHIPVALAVLVPALAVLVLAFTWRRPAQSALALLVAAQGLMVAGGFVAMSTGEETEEVVERVVAESAIHEHEERAEVFVWTAVAGLVLAGAALALSQRNKAGAARAVLIAFTVTSLGVAFLGFRTGQAGGELVYVHGAASAYATGGGAEAPAAPPRAGRHHDDDDDD